MSDPKIDLSESDVPSDKDLLTEDVEHLTKLRETLLASVNKAKEEVQVIRGLRTNLEAEVEKLTHPRDSLLGQTEILLKEIEEKSKELKAREEELQVLERELEAIKTSIRESEGVAKEIVRKAREEASFLLKDADDSRLRVEARVNAAQTELRVLTDKIVEASGRLTSIVSQLSSTEMRLRSLEDAISRETLKLEEVKRSQILIEGESARVQRSITEEQARLGVIRSELASVYEETKTAESERDRIQGEVSRVKEIRDRMRREALGLTDKMQTLIEKESFIRGKFEQAGVPWEE